MKNKLIIALFIGTLLVSGIAFAQEASTTVTNTTITVPACPTFVAVDVAALRIKCAAEGGIIYQPEATTGCLPPPICQKTDRFICPMIAIPEMEQFTKNCTADGGRVVARSSNNGCQLPPVCERQLVRRAELTISPVGQFLARGMVVKSVATTTFIGEVWGTAWTVDFSNVKNIILKSGSEQSVDTVATQVQVGQEVGVQGRVVNGVVVAQIVRNYNQTEIIKPLPGTPLYGKKIEKLEDRIEKKAEDFGNSSQSRIQEMMKQLQELQNKLKGANR